MRASIDKKYDEIQNFKALKRSYWAKGEEDAGMEVKKHVDELYLQFIAGKAFLSQYVFD